MKRHLTSILWWQRGFLTLAALSSLAVACGRGDALRGSPLQPPTLNAAPSTYTHNPNLLLGGTRPPQTDVVAVLSNGSEKVLCVANASEGTGAPVCSTNPNAWTGVLTLAPGQNTFSLFARRTSGAGRSANTNPYSVLLVALQTPGLNNVLINGVLYVYVGGSGNNPAPPSVSDPLSGTKSADGDLEMTFNGAHSTPAGIDNRTTWNANIIVAHGGLDPNNNQCSQSCALVSKDAAGDVSGALSFCVAGTYEPSPTINAYNAVTSVVGETLSGTKPAGSTLYFVLNDGANVQISTTPAQISSSTWSYSFDLQEGTNIAAFYVVGNADVYPSAPAVATITLVSEVQPPQFNPPLPAVFPPTDASSLTLTATLPTPGSYLCVSYDAWDGTSAPPPCLATSQKVGPGGGTVVVQVPLTDAENPNAGSATNPSGNGNNTLYITARAGAGTDPNLVSPQLSTTIFRVSPPVVDGVNIANNSVITQPTTNLTFTAAPYSADANVAGAQIASWEVCVDTTCSAPALPNNSGVYNYPVDLSAAPNGSAHTITVTVTDALGGQTVTTINVVYSTGAAIWLSNDANTMHGARVPKVALDSAGNLHAVWEDDCAQVTDCHVTGVHIPPDIFYAKRGVNGAWSSIVLVSANDATDGTSNSPSIAVDSSGTVHVAWADNGSEAGKPSGAFAIVHRTIDATSGALGAIDVVGSPNASIDDVNPALAADATSGVVHVAFSHHSDPNDQLLYAQLPRGGTWSTPLVLSSATAAKADLPAIAAMSGSKAVVAWQDCTTFDPNYPANNWCDATNANNVTVNGNNPYNTANYDIYLRYVTGASSADVNTVLVTDKRKNTGGDGDSRRPALLVDTTGLTWVFWDDTSNLSGVTNVSNIWYRQYQGDTPQSTAYSLVSGDPNQQQAAQATVAMGADANNTMVVAWSATFVGGTGGPNIFAVSGPGATENLSGLPVVHLYSDSSAGTRPLGASAPSVAIDSVGALHAMWQDTSSPSPSNPNPPTPNPPLGQGFPLIFYNYFSEY